MKFYSEAAMERAMKIQEVILRAIGKRINWWQAAEIIGIRRPADEAVAQPVRAVRLRRACLTGGGESRVRGGYPWGRWRRCWGCIRRSTLTSTCGTFTKSCGKSTASG